MSLATRCTACGTVFKVVQDQLKVSEGWVRCGRCNEVFNALEGLFDLEREAPPEETPIDTETVPAPQPQVAHRVIPAEELPPPDERFGPAPTEQIDEALFASRPGEPDTLLAHAFDDESAAAEHHDARVDPELLTDEAAQLAARKAGKATRPGRSARSSRTRREVTPGFLRAAERQARWQRPGVRLTLSLLALGLTASLGMQVVHHHRNIVAAKWPQTRSALLGWCNWMQCTLEPPRRIEDIFVESTTLARTASGEGFRLAVNLRNRGNLPLALPSVDLNLTDGNGRLVARRVLSPRDFGTRLIALQPGADTSLQLQLSAGNTQVTGYTVEVFYP
jgi:predicted Zn finger-like uncharacterized protein